jgi:sugar lactone lactonase YvrE
VATPVSFGTMAVFARVNDPGAPEGVVIDDRGRAYVATNNAGQRGRAGPSRVFRYSPGGAIDRQITIAGQADGRQHGLLGLAADKDGRLLALDAAPARVLRLDLDSGTQERFAFFPNLPACLLVISAPTCEPGPRDNAPLPRAAVRDKAGNLYVTDAGQGTIWRVRPGGGEAEVWHQSNDFLSTSSGLGGIALDAQGNVIVAVTSSLSPATLNSGVVYRVPVQANGRPGTHTQVARTGMNEAPVGLAVGKSGRIYLALSSAHQLLVLEPGGQERGRITADQARERTSVPFDAPVGLAFRGQSLLITNQSATNDPARWVVFDVSVQDSAAT